MTPQVTTEEVRRKLEQTTFRLGGDLTVHRLGYGAMRLTGPGVWGPPRDLDAAKRVLHRAVELGVNLIDTADSYGPFVNEELIGAAFPEYPEGLVLATKGGLTRPGPGEWRRHATPRHLREALDGSLQRLHLERIDLYQLHAPDPRVPLEDQVGTLAEARDEGKIRHVGLSNVTVDQLDRAREIVPVVSVQNQYSLEDRSSEDVLDRCEELGIGFIPWYPLGSGALAHKGGTLTEVADRLGATPPQVALAWLLKRSPVMLPIPGTSRVEHLEENLRAVAVDLSDEDFDRLDAIAK